jgi:proline iminopeptidase
VQQRRFSSRPIRHLSAASTGLQRTFDLFPASVTDLAEELRGKVELAWGPEVIVEALGGLGEDRPLGIRKQGRGERMRVFVDGADLYYTTLGSGPPCLVLSAIGTKPYVQMTPPALRDRLQLVYVDLRGGGQSTGQAADLTFDVLADDLEAIRADLGVDRVAVLGHSVLGILAIEYGRRCPESVSHVIAVGTPPSWSPEDLATKSESFFEADASDARKQVLRDNLAKLPQGASPGQRMLAQTPMRFFDPQFDAAPLFAESEFRPELLERIMGTLTHTWDVRTGASSLTVPTLIAHGRYDYAVPYVLWQGVADTLPNTTLKMFDRSGHQPFLEQAEEFASTVADWMARQRNDAVQRADAADEG